MAMSAKCFCDLSTVSFVRFLKRNDKFDQNNTHGVLSFVFNLLRMWGTLLCSSYFKIYNSLTSREKKIYYLVISCNVVDTSCCTGTGTHWWRRGCWCHGTKWYEDTRTRNTYVNGVFLRPCCPDLTYSSIKCHWKICSWYPLSGASLWHKNRVKSQFSVQLYLM